MWFNPAELSENNPDPFANSANSANYEPINLKESTPISKLAGLAAANNHKFVNCGKCLNFKCHNSHGKGAGICTIGGDYGQWSETPHQCTKFDAAVEWIYETYAVTPGALIINCYTPNGKVIEVEARDKRHAAWLQKMNPKRLNYGE